MRTRSPAGSFRPWKNLPWTSSWAFLRPLPCAASGALRGAHAAAGCPVTRPAAPQAGGECPWSRPALDGCTQLSRWPHKPTCFPTGFLLAAPQGPGPPRHHPAEGTSAGEAEMQTDGGLDQRGLHCLPFTCIRCSFHTRVGGRGGAWSFPEKWVPGLEPGQVRRGGGEAQAVDVTSDLAQVSGLDTGASTGPPLSPSLPEPTGMLTLTPRTVLRFKERVCHSSW